jgi:hypothetical protein
VGPGSEERFDAHLRGGGLGDAVLRLLGGPSHQLDQAGRQVPVPELSALMDEPGELLPLLTLGEGRTTLRVAHLLGLGDAEGADAAREMEMRLERRLTVMFPGQDIRLKSVSYDS